MVGFKTRRDGRVFPTSHNTRDSGMPTIITTRDKFGFVNRVTNPKGTLAPVRIAESADEEKGGAFAAIKDQGDLNKQRVIARSDDAEGLAQRLAIKGHKSVRILS